MIKKFQDYISEGLWKSGVERAKNNTERLEDGVKLEIGTKIKVGNRLIDYNELVKKILNYVPGEEYDDAPMSIIYISTLDWEQEKQIRETGEATSKFGYIFLIQEITDRYTLCVHFDNYESFIENYAKSSKISEDDYVAMCRGIADKLKTLDVVTLMRNEVDDSLHYHDVYHDTITIFNFKKGDKKLKKFSFTRFEKEFENQFKGKYRDIFYLEGHSLSVELTYDAIMNLDEFVKFTKRYMRNLSKGVNEGLWKDGVDRAKSGEMRIEDIPNLNLDSIKECNFLIDGKPLADRDVMDVDSRNRLFDRKEMKSILFKMKKSGWRLPTCDEMKTLIGEGEYIDRFKYESKVVDFMQGGGGIKLNDITSNEPASVWEISYRRGDSFPIPFWLEDGEMKVGAKNKIVHMSGRKRVMTLRILQEQTDEPKRIILIKDNPINEGLWKSGIERAKSDKTRLGDADPLQDVFKFFKRCIKTKFPKTNIVPQMEVGSKTTCHLSFSPFDGKTYFLNMEFFVKYGRDGHELDTRKVYTAFWNELNNWVHTKRDVLNNQDLVNDADNDKLRQDLKKYEYIAGVFLERLEKTISPKLSKEEVRDILLNTNDI